MDDNGHDGSADSGRTGAGGPHPGFPHPHPKGWTGPLSHTSFPNPMSSLFVSPIRCAWDWAYALPERLDVLVAERPLRDDFVLAVFDGVGCVQAEVSRLELLSARSRSALVCQKIEGALGLGWDADGREVPA